MNVKLGIYYLNKLRFNQQRKLLHYNLFVMRSEEFGIIVNPFVNPIRLPCMPYMKSRTNNFHTRRNSSNEMMMLNLFYTRYIHDIHYRNYTDAEDCIFVDVVKYMKDCTVKMT